MTPTPAAPLPFGKYLLLEKIASGGMAEVYRAVLRGTAGFEKQVALKRVLSVFSEEPEFITLFQDEARIASTLSHANIAQVFEFGEVDGAYYLTLELVEGLDLARLVRSLRTAGQPMPMATAAFVVAEAARGLAYAHEKTGPDGHRIGLVHRDVSPPNVLLSRAGEVKVADFGIAKAAGKVHKTETGVLMGKLRYMSPEQIAGDELDARSDIFSLGVILYELLADGPIFKGEQTVRLAELIQKAEIPPPSARNPAVPPALDEIVMKALARPRERRYGRAADLARDLSVFVSGAAPSFTREDLGALVSAHLPTGPAATMPTELASRDAQPTRNLAAPVPATLPPRRRRSVFGVLGLALLVVLAGSGVLVLARFALPGDESRAIDAGRLVVSAIDAGQRPVDPPPTAAFTLVPTASRDEAVLLGRAMMRHDVSMRGLASREYHAYLTGLDSALALLTLDGEGRAAELPALPPVVELLVARAGVAEAVQATMEHVRGTGELPKLVASKARDFLRTHPAVRLDSNPPHGPYAAALLAAWIMPASRDNLQALARANDALGRWCAPPPAPARHFAPVGCERDALVAELRQHRGEVLAAALERWEASAARIGDGLELVHLAYEGAMDPREVTLRIELSAPPPSIPALLAGGLAVARPFTDADGTFFVVVPRDLVAPVVAIEGVAGHLRIPPPPFGAR